jgi:hypothetical protein
MFKRIPIKMDVDYILSAQRTLVQVSDVANRAKYMYTDWQEESAPPTPLLMYSLPDDIVSSILDHIPDSLLMQEIPKVHLMSMPKPCKESRSLPPHVDRGRRAAINIYLDTGGEITEFYNVDLENKKLTPIGSFTASNGEVWLLDVSIPHAVLMREKQERLGLSLSFRRLRYNQIVDILGSV